MELKFKWGPDFEITRVKNTLAKYDWYLSKGYKPRLPDGITPKSSEKEIKNQISIEYQEKIFKECSHKIAEEFLIIQDNLSKKLKKLFNEIPEKFEIYLTQYGVAGSYNRPNKIIFNAYNINGYKTIVHEIIHLIIEDNIEKYKIQHWEKERIVDLILNSQEFQFLKYNKWQKDYHGAEKYIDKIFKKYFFKNPEKFFSLIETARRG